MQGSEEYSESGTLQFMLMSDSTKMFVYYIINYHPHITACLNRSASQTRLLLLGAAA